jgi:hypothetical protein
MLNNGKSLGLKIILIFSAVVSIAIDLMGFIKDLAEFVFVFIALFLIFYGLNMLGMLKIIQNSLLMILKWINLILEKIKKVLFSQCSRLCKKKVENKTLEEKTLIKGNEDMVVAKKKTTLKKTSSNIKKAVLKKTKVSAVKKSKPKKIRSEDLKMASGIVKKKIVKKTAMKIRPVKKTTKKIGAKKTSLKK